MIVEILLLVIVVLLIVRPFVQRQRERKLAERLKQVRDPREAAMLVDSAIHANQREGGLMEKLRNSYWFWLR